MTFCYSIDTHGAAYTLALTPYAEVDDNGLIDLQAPEGADPQAIDACIADHLPPPVRHLWPCWEVLRQHDPH